MRSGRQHCLFGLLVTATLSSACSDRKVRSVGGSGDLTLSNSLLSAADAIAASNAIADAPIQSCSALAAGLAALDARPQNRRFDPRSYRGLVEELVEAAQSACPVTKAHPALLNQAGPAARLALSLVEVESEAALKLLGDDDGDAALLLRRSELLFRLDRHSQGRAALIKTLALHDDEEVRATAARLTLLAGESEEALALCRTSEAPALQALRVAALASLGRYEAVREAVRAAPAHLRRELAEHAARFAIQPLAMVESADTPALLLLAVAAELAESEPATSVQLLARAAALLPDDADVHSDLAEALEARGRSAEAVSSWDRVLAIAPGAERATLAAIRLLRENGAGKRALERASRLQSRAKVSKSADDWRLASLAFKYAGDSARALALAKLAVEVRSSDGRLVSELAERQQEANRRDEAAATLATLLACGTHGRPWHRHEIMARLTALADAASIRRLVASASCTVVEPDDLASFLEPGTGGSD